MPHRTVQRIPKARRRPCRLEPARDRPVFRAGGVLREEEAGYCYDVCRISQYRGARTASSARRDKYAHPPLFVLPLADIPQTGVDVTPSVDLPSTRKLMRDTVTDAITNW